MGRVRRVRSDRRLHPAVGLGRGQATERLARRTRRRRWHGRSDRHAAPRPRPATDAVARGLRSARPGRGVRSRGGRGPDGRGQTIRSRSAHRPRADRPGGRDLAPVDRGARGCRVDGECRSPDAANAACRPRPGRRGALVGPPLEVAAVREQGAPRGGDGRGHRRRGSRRLLPDLRRDRRAGRLHPSRPVGIRGRVPGVRPRRAGAPAHGPPGRRHAGGDARAAALRGARDRAVRRNDRGGGGFPSQLPAQVGGDPEFPGGRLRGVRHVGPVARGDRAVQVGLRRARGDVRRWASAGRGPYWIDGARHGPQGERGPGAPPSRARWRGDST